MTNQTFDPTLHPRDSKSGEFTANVRPESPDPLRSYGATPVSTLLPQEANDAIFFRPAEIGEDQYGPVDYIDLTRDRWRDEEDRNPDLIEMKAVHTLNLLNYREYETETEWEAWLLKNHVLVDDFFGERYGADTDYEDETDSVSQYSDVQVMFYLEHPSSSITLTEVLAKVEGETKIGQLAAEADHGSYGTENLGRLLREHVAERVAAKQMWFGEVGRVTDGQVDSAVDSCFGKREVADVIARRIAYEYTAHRPAMNSFAMRGHAKRDDLRDEIVAAYAEETSPRKRRWLDMLGTWVINGGDND